MAETRTQEIGAPVEMCPRGQCPNSGCNCGYELPEEVDPTPWCSYGHRTKASCDCGPIAENE